MIKKVILLLILSVVSKITFACNQNIWALFPHNSLLARECLRLDACPECTILERLIKRQPYTDAQARHFLEVLYPESFQTVGFGNEWGHRDWPMIELRDYIYFVTHLCMSFKRFKSNSMTPEEIGLFYKDLRFLIEDLVINITKEGSLSDCQKAEELFLKEDNHD